MSDAIIFDNARIALPDAIVEGWVAVSGGIIRDVGAGKSAHRADRIHDLAGDLLIPGLIEIHTDHLETHLRPRPKVDWPLASAVLSFDAQVAACGITTVFDCVRAGQDADYAPLVNEVSQVIAAVSRAQDAGILRAEHKIHLRCEICAEDVLESVAAAISRFGIDMMSLMDHTPGARQFTSLDAWRTYYGGKSGLSLDQLDRLMERKHELHATNYKGNRARLVELARAHGIVLASHDDSTPDHVGESIAEGVSIAEFPTSQEAANLSHEAGISVMMGAPNVVRGGSHSGNVAAETLARAGVLDVLSSDYVPASLLFGAFELARRIEGFGLAPALRTITLNPARAAGLDDRGEIAAGKRADLVRVTQADALPVVREVYRGGHRVV